MKHFILITNAYKDKDLRLSNQIIDYIVEKSEMVPEINKKVERV